MSPGLPGAAPQPPRARALPGWVAALSVAAAVALAALGAPAVHAAEALPQVRIEHTFALGADAVWARLGRFCSIAEWQSLVAGCVVDERRDGIHRTVVMRNDTAYVERLERFSHEERRLAYSILSGPLAVRRYVSELQVLPVDAKRSRLVWQAWYELPAGTEAAAVARDGMLSSGMDPWLVEAFIELFGIYRAGHGGAVLSAAVEAALGRPAATLARFAADHAHAFQRAV